MGTHYWQVFKLALAELDPETLKAIWDRGGQELQSYFIGISIQIGEKRLTLFSRDFCQKIFDHVNVLDCEERLALMLMSRDLIGYAANVIQQCNIIDPKVLAEMALLNGRIAALDAMPQRERVWDKLQTFSPDVFISCVSYELYDLLGLWDTLFKDKRNPIQVLLAMVDRVIIKRDTVTAQWISLHLNEFIKRNEKIFNAVLIQYQFTLQTARIWAKHLEDPSIIALVDSLLARIR